MQIHSKCRCGRNISLRLIHHSHTASYPQLYQLPMPSLCIPLWPEMSSFPSFPDMVWVQEEVLFLLLPRLWKAIIFFCMPAVLWFRISSVTHTLNHWYNTPHTAHVDIQTPNTNLPRISDLSAYSSKVGEWTAWGSLFRKTSVFPCHCLFFMEGWTWLRAAQ